jgi:hypothetical protein
VDSAVREWATAQAAARPQLIRLGYFGSYARGDWGVGSDVDLVAVVASAARPFRQRGRDWDTRALPVPADLLVYTEAEFAEVVQRGDRFAGVMTTEVVWVQRRAGGHGGP